MDAQVLNNLLTVQSYLTTLEGMIERLENELTPSEKQILEDLRSQYHSARLVYVQQMGISIPVEPNEPQKEPHKEPAKEDSEKKVQAPRPQQKQQPTQVKKPKEEYPE